MLSSCARADPVAPSTANASTQCAAVRRSHSIPGMSVLLTIAAGRKEATPRPAVACLFMAYPQGSGCGWSSNVCRRRPRGSSSLRHARLETRQYSPIAAPYHQAVAGPQRGPRDCPEPLRDVRPGVAAPGVAGTYPTKDVDDLLPELGARLAVRLNCGHGC